MNKYSASDVSLYVPCYNAISTIERCLEGVLSQTVMPSRIILVDDGSTPPLSLSGRFIKDVEILIQPVNMGLSAARNKALSNISSPLVASLDSDVVPASRWLETLLDTMNSFDIAGAGGRLNEFYQDTLGDRWRAVHMAQHWGDAPLMNPRFIYGANNIFRTDILASLGNYNSELRTNYEDMLMCELLYSKGYKMRYEPSALCSHLRKDTEESILRGFWQWFHAKGIINGEFKSPEGILDRITRVNFGVGRYRYKMDKEAGRNDFLKLDILIPWVFCALDLKKASSIGLAGELPLFPEDEELSLLPDHLAKLLGKIIGPAPRATVAKPWHSEYHRLFGENLKDYGTGADL
ncbi:MAG: hypothetical protein A2020_15195 [Lentisphaerae bacterium GWF2_45_14]|nr:MAG: hypothetical protein A2020_15195 [Lentisphaerae bacterium GWF2_45_14]